MGHDVDLLGSREVISHVTIRLAVVDLLLVVHCDHASIWHHYRDIANWPFEVLPGTLCQEPRSIGCDNG